jgi:uncharacterized OB-fold protein
MSYFLPTMPRPEPNMDDEGFWEKCALRELSFQSCQDCNALRHPPTPVCWNCRSMRVAWTKAPRIAEIFSYTVVHHAIHDAVAERVPYVVASVAFPELPGPRLLTNITDCDPLELFIGMPVELWWDDIGDGMYLYRFKPTSREEQA